VDYSKKRIGAKARSIGKRGKSIEERTHGKPCLRFFVPAMEILYIFPMHKSSTKMEKTTIVAVLLVKLSKVF